MFLRWTLGFLGIGRIYIMSYKNVPFGTPEKFNVVIEIPKGSEVKY